MQFWLKKVIALILVYKEREAILYNGFCVDKIFTEFIFADVNFLNFVKFFFFWFPRECDWLTIC